MEVEYSVSFLSGTLNAISFRFPGYVRCSQVFSKNLKKYACRRIDSTVGWRQILQLVFSHVCGSATPKFQYSYGEEVREARNHPRRYLVESPELQWRILFHNAILAPERIGVLPHHLYQ